MDFPTSLGLLLFGRKQIPPKQDSNYFQSEVSVYKVRHFLLSNTFRRRSKGGNHKSGIKEQVRPIALASKSPLQGRSQEETDASDSHHYMPVALMGNMRLDMPMASAVLLGPYETEPAGATPPAIFHGIGEMSGFRNHYFPIF